MMVVNELLYLSFVFDTIERLEFPGISLKHFKSNKSQKQAQLFICSSSDSGSMLDEWEDKHLSRELWDLLMDLWYFVAKTVFQTQICI